GEHCGVARVVVNDHQKETLSLRARARGGAPDIQVESLKGLGGRTNGGVRGGAQPTLDAGTARRKTQQLDQTREPDQTQLPGESRQPCETREPDGGQRLGSGAAAAATAVAAAAAAATAADAAAAPAAAGAAAIAAAALGGQCEGCRDQSPTQR
ncbi:unnamed protein product, partial [Closterium sp. NIES-53]